MMHLRRTPRPRARPGARLAALAPLALLAALGIVATFGLVAGCSGRSPPACERIVLVTLDTLRYDAWEGERAAMPRLAEAARQGTIFEQAWSATSTTLPTHASLLTGLHPWEHGVLLNGAVLDGAFETVPERLRAAGWDTWAVTASFPLIRRFGLDQGFERFEDVLDSPGAASARGGEEGRFVLGADVTQRALAALDALEERGGERQFLWVHYFDAHSPYGDTTGEVIQRTQLTNAARARSPALDELIARARELYEADVASLDRELGRLLDRLATGGGRCRTHVIVTADHGESLGDDGSFGHGKRLTRQTLHVPLIILSPRAERGRQGDPAASVDVAATLLSLAGLPPDPASRGRDLTLPPGAADGARQPVVGMRRVYHEPEVDVRTTGEAIPIEGHDFFLVVDNRLVRGNREALHAEGEPLPPEEAARIRALFGAFEAALSSRRGEELLDEETQSALRALGYTR